MFSTETPIILHDNALDMPSIIDESDMCDDRKRRMCIQGDVNISYADGLKNVQVIDDDSCWELLGAW